MIEQSKNKANFRKIALMFVKDELFRASETKLKAVLGVYGKTAKQTRSEIS